MTTTEDTSRLVFWLLGAMLTIAVSALGWYVRSLDGQLTTLEARIEAYSQRELARAETLTATSGARWERLSVIEARVVSMEPRINDLSSKGSALEARMPLAESKISSADARLVRIEQKLDDLAQRILQGRSSR